MRRSSFVVNKIFFFKPEYFCGSGVLLVFMYDLCMDVIPNITRQVPCRDNSPFGILGRSGTRMAFTEPQHCWRGGSSSLEGGAILPTGE